MNLPPGVVFMDKTFEKIDYSYKLTNQQTNNVEASNFMKKFSNDEIQLLLNGDSAESYYYKEAIKYFNSLSKKVKLLFNEEELWYIYMFDQKLKNKLQTINN